VYCLFAQVGVNTVGKIQYLRAELLNDAGCSSNEEIAIYAIKYLQNCYAADTNWEVIGKTLTTNTPANTALRAPGKFEYKINTKY